MRGLLTVILFIIFFFSFSIAAYTYSINSVFTADYVKERLDKSKIYSVVADELPEFVARSQGEGDELVPVEVKKEFKAFVKKEVSGQYLQGKIEPFVDDIFAWLSGKTNDTPQLSFADLAVKLKKQPAAHFLSDDMNKVLNNPLKLPLLEDKENLRSGYQLSQVAPVALSVLSVIVLLAIFLMARNWRSKLRKVTLALFIPAALGLITAGLLLFIGSVIIEMVTGALKDSEFTQFQKPLKELLIQVPLDVGVRMGMIYGVALTVSAVLFIASFFVERGRKVPTSPAAQK